MPPRSRSLRRSTHITLRIPMWCVHIHAYHAFTYGSHTHNGKLIPVIAPIFDVQPYIDIAPPPRVPATLHCHCPLQVILMKHNVDVCLKRLLFLFYLLDGRHRSGRAFSASCRPSSPPSCATSPHAAPSPVPPTAPPWSGSCACGSGHDEEGRGREGDNRGQ